MQDVAAAAQGAPRAQLSRQKMLVWLGTIIPVLNGLGRVAGRVHLAQFYRRGIYATMAHRLTGLRPLYTSAAVCDSL